LCRDAMLKTELQDAGAGATCGSESAATSESEDGEVQSTPQHSVGPKQE
jgi:hypothetical protein